MKKILGISGSPNSGGNTAYAVRYALGILKEGRFETKYLSLSGRKIEPCTGCWKCSESAECFHRDGMDEIVKAMLWCDALIIGTPVYLGLVSGQLKVMMDRSVVLRQNCGPDYPMAGKIGAAIACANSRNGGQETALQNIQTYMLQMNMLVISDGPEYCHAGGTIAGDAEKDKWGLETVKNLALNAARILKNR